MLGHLLSSIGKHTHHAQSLLHKYGALWHKICPVNLFPGGLRLTDNVQYLLISWAWGHSSGWNPVLLFNGHFHRRLNSEAVSHTPPMRKSTIRWVIINLENRLKVHHFSTNQKPWNCPLPRIQANRHTFPYTVRTRLLLNRVLQKYVVQKVETAQAFLVMLEGDY